MCNCCLNARRLAGIFGCTGVALGAFGAHSLAETLAARAMEGVWETAVFYHLVHAVAILVLGEGESARASKILIFWVLGVLLFSGSLYALALGGPRWLGPVTPIGGFLFLLGWLWLCLPEKKTT